MSARANQLALWMGISASAFVIIGGLAALCVFIGHYAPLPDKVNKLSDIVWQDHDTLSRIEVKLNMDQNESPRIKQELSEVFSNELAVASAVTVTNN